jgi:hypothetical protein
MRSLAIVTLVTPFLVALQAGLFGWLIWDSRTHNSGRGPALKDFGDSPPTTSVPTFGRR